MSTNRCCIAGIMVWASMILCCAPAVGDPLVYATIQPAQVTLGESARFTITTLGDVAAPFTMPIVSGLRFEVVGRARQIELINGTTLPSTSIIVRVTPQMAGIFTIPAITPKSQPLVLQVNSPGSVAVPPPGRARLPNPPPPPPPILSGASLPKGIQLTEDGSAYLRLTIPKRDVYVGESVPIEIEVGLRSGFVSSLNGLPKLTGENFTLNNFSHEPERTEKLIDGQPFVLLTWHSMLSVVKPGTFPLSAEIPLTVKIRTRPRRDSALDDQFGDPFWQNLFGATVPKDITVPSPTQELKVQELPALGRPPDFHGAIGTFTVESDVSPTKADAGDPLTVRMHISGAGNFDRVDSPMFEHLEQWKTYPPKSTFTSADPIGHKGEKVFEQPLIALKPGEQTLPELHFSYFDPSTHHYETARSSPLKVTISPSLAASLPKVRVSEEGSGSEVASGLYPDRPETAAASTSLLPLYMRPPFLAISSFLALAFSAAWTAARRRVHPAQKTPGQSRAGEKATRRALAQIEASARNGDHRLFFNLARLALQQALAARWHMPLQEVTEAEIRARLSEDSDIQQIFAFDDELKYSGSDVDSADLARLTRAVRRRLMAEET